ncbi:MAG: prephenate dehydratase [Saprospiraceae bacterium]|nr:prephenate dehydratase [Saprospiraceae bacterium]
MMKVAIQGYPGAFHEIAARLFYQDEIEVVPADTFEEVVSLVESHDKADTGIMAIENSIAGSILYNYNLLNQSNLQIIGEVFLRIKQNLMAIPGNRIEDLEEVHSHPMAIAQCKEFFRSYPGIKLVETKDTAESARYIHDNGLNHIGALGSVLAAELYHLDIIVPGIETDKRNYTRFILIDHFIDAPNQQDFDKVSVSFAVSHEIGSLYKALKTLSDHGANLTKIQSAPITGRPWEYLFFVDFLLQENSRFGDVIQGLTMTTRGLKILGKYKTGKQHEL